MPRRRQRGLPGDRQRPQAQVRERSGEPGPVKGLPLERELLI